MKKLLWAVSMVIMFFSSCEVEYRSEVRYNHFNGYEHSHYPNHHEAYNHGYHHDEHGGEINQHPR